MGLITLFYGVALTWKRNLHVHGLQLHGWAIDELIFYAIYAWSPVDQTLDLVYAVVRALWSACPTEINLGGIYFC